MKKGFLLKAVFLTAVLAAVVGLLAKAKYANIPAAATEAPRAGTYFEQFFAAGGPIVWFILLPMSMVTVFLAAKYCLTIRRKKLLPEGTSRTIVELVKQFGFTQLAARLAGREDLVSAAIIKAITQGRGDWQKMRELAVESLQEQALRFMRNIEWVNIIGNVSPMVGLLGTVLGIIKMFSAIAQAGGQPQPAQLAGGISIALVATLWGLMIAIPALTVHGVFQNRLELLAGEALAETEKLLVQMAGIYKEQKSAEQARPPQNIVEIPAKKPAGTLRSGLQQ
jgi:biopolymer transport protein ExbB